MENRELLMQLKEELYNLCLLDDSSKGDAYFDGTNFKYIRVKSLSEFPDVFVCSNEKVKPLKLAKKRKSLTKIKRENRREREREREIQKLKREIRKAEEKRLAQEEKERAEEAARLEAEIIKAEEKQEKERGAASPDSLNFALYKFMKGEAKFYKGKLYVEIFGIFHVWYIKGKKLIARQVNNYNYEGYIKGKEYIEKYHSYFLPKEVK